jgi:hypothetical protein
MKRRTAHSTIDLLLRENKFLSITLWFLAVLSTLCGTVMLGFGMRRNQPILARAGAVEMSCSSRSGASSRHRDVKTG